jgi:tetratricopeptide (TPR) repeat protein
LNRTFRIYVISTFALFSALAMAYTLPSEWVGAGDEAYRNRVSETSARVALDDYRTAFSSSKEVDTSWRLAMAAYFVGFRYTPTRDAKIKLFSEGRDAALFGISKDTNCAQCHFWAAVNMALYGDSVGILKMLFSLGDVQAHLREVVTLDPLYAHAGAYRILGIIDKKLPGILGGSKERALEYFKAAVELTPKLPLNALFLAQWYESEDDKAQAAEIAERVTSLAMPPKEELEEVEALSELQKLFDRNKEFLAKRIAAAKEAAARQTASLGSETKR